MVNKIMDTREKELFSRLVKTLNLLRKQLESREGSTLRAEQATPMVSVNEPRFNCRECGASVAESYRSKHVCEPDYEKVARELWQKHGFNLSPDEIASLLRQAFESPREG